MGIDWIAYIEKYEDNLLKSVIPFWEENCVDIEFGGYFHFLDEDGSVYDTRKYMWMEWRIVYMFAHLATTVYGKKNSENAKKWLEIAVHGFNFLTQYGKDKGGNYYFGLNRQGDPIVAPYNIFSEAFAMMGSTALYNATKEDKYMNEAIAVFENYLIRMDNPKMQWEKTLSGAQSWKSQGFFMVFLNFDQFLTPLGLMDSDMKNQLRNGMDTILNKFWRPDLGVILENLTQDFEEDLSTCDGRRVIPGHGLESLWFMLQYIQNAKDMEQTEKDEYINKIIIIIKSILDFGWDTEFGGIFYFLDVKGKPPIELEWDMKLWWVHNEAILACLYGYNMTQDGELLEWFVRLDEWVWEHFPDKQKGWYGYLNRRGEPTHLLKGGKWKTFFHLPRFLLLGIEQMRKQTKE